MQKVAVVPFAALAVMAGIPCTLVAQRSVECPVRVTVTDESGAVIPGARVGARGSPLEALTDAQGVARISLCSGGALFIRAQGFDQKSVGLDSPPASEIHVSLRVGQGGGIEVTSRPQPELLSTPVSALMVSEAPQAQSASANDNQTLTLSGPGGTTSLSLGSLKSLHHVSVTVKNGHSGAQETYSGVPLIELLEKVGAPEPAAVNGKALSDYIVATGSDKYHAVLSLAEVEPGFHPGQVLVADTLNGKPLDTKEGPIKLIVEEDQKPARWVHNLVKLELRQAE